MDSNTVVRLNGILAEQQSVSATTFSRNRWYGVPGRRWLVGSAGYTFSEWRQATGQGATDQYTATRPTVDEVFVRRDAHEANRAIVVVYNWSGSTSAQVDLSEVLAAGQPYTVHHVYRLFGDPVAQGTYQGGAVSVPLVPLFAPVPLAGWPTVVSQTAPDFWVFVVRGQ